MKYKIDLADDHNIKITATKDIVVGEIIGLWVTEKRMSAPCRQLFQEHMEKEWWETADIGRYCNHSDYPNTSVTATTSELMLYAKSYILMDEEITVNYNEVQIHTGYIPITIFNI